jgi:class 3 adenylate cyclase
VIEYMAAQWGGKGLHAACEPTANGPSSVVPHQSDHVHRAVRPPRDTAQPGRIGGGDEGAGGSAVLRQLMEGASHLDMLATTHECVTLLFCDIVGFTTMSKEVQPMAVMRFLNDLYSKYDQGAHPMLLPSNVA